MAETVIVRPEDFQVSPFELIGNQWLLLAAENEGKTNAMTCSWGGLGVLWKKNVAFVFVRRSRYTKEFIDRAERFSLSWFDDPGHKLLGYFGSVSGRDQDKIAKSGLTLERRENTPCFGEATKTIICRKLYAQEQDMRLFADPAMEQNLYSDRDYHTMYVGEILEITRRK